MSRLAAFLRSMAGRIFILLLPGVLISSLIALGLADAKWRHDLDREHLEWAADRAADFISLLNSVPGPVRARLADHRGPGVRFAGAEVKAIGRVPALAALLTSRTGAPATADVADANTCMPPRPGYRPPPPPGNEAGLRMRPPQCWVVETRLRDGTPVRLAVMGPPMVSEDHGLDPYYLGLLALGVAIVAVVVARVAAAPINDLGGAARALGADLDRDPLAETGPTEVRDAARAFNAMQKRLQSGLTERTQMLASITHDLQTPLTRLRLRLEKVTDEDLQRRLIADLAAMQSLIREGLDLARSAETTEPFAAVDVDALLESLVEDAIEVGGQASLVGRCEVDVPARPMALRRCLSNLIDNALKYGGDVEVSTSRRQDVLTIAIRDHGPGIPEGDLTRVFESFVRLETSRSRETGGAGLGLAIARTLAEKCNAALSLRNHFAGGLEATLELEISRLR